MSPKENNEDLFVIDEVGAPLKTETQEPNLNKKKRSKNSEDQLRSHKTLFVRNLPQTTKDEEFQDFFEQFGPLKSCFVVRGPNDKLCKGYGFVNFSMKEDGEKAIKVCETEKFLGKFLKLEWAIKKSIEDRDQAKIKEGIPDKKHRGSKNQHKSDLNEIDRTVAITGLPNSVGRPQLVKFLESHNHSPQEIVYKGGRGLAIVTFETVEIAQMAISGLQNQTLGGGELIVQFHQTLVSKTKPNRLIVKNLPFKLSEPELTKIANQYGTLVECKLPRHTETNKPLGFGFIQYLELSMSEKALKELNQKEFYGRNINVDWCSGKDFVSKDDQVSDQIAKAEKEEDDLENYGANAQMFEDGQSDDVLTSDESSSDDDSDNDEADEDKSDDEDKSYEDENQADSDLENDNEPADDTNAAESSNSNNANCTLFVRNILFETTEQDLFEHFSEFGPVKYARVVVDPIGRSRGTGFVNFYRASDAKKVLDEAKLAKASMPSSTPNSKSVLVPELPQSQTSRLMLQDRLLDVVLAVDKDEATKLANPSKKKDRKNLYLLKEGVIFPKTPEAAGLPEAEVTKRLKSHDLRKRQLEKNPSLFLSKCRLAIRNIPIDWTDKELRTLAREAVPNFKREVKEGKRPDLTKEEKEEGWDHKPKLKQVKVEVDRKSVNATTGKAKSKGFGFIEFEHHSHALATLRYLNCNTDIKGLNKEAKEAKGEQEAKGRKNRKLLLVEFSVENKLVLKRRDDRKRKLTSIANSAKKDNSEKDDAPTKKQKLTFKGKGSQSDANKGKKKKFFHKGN